MNAINKNEPSMFKVGDKVVFGSGLNAGLFTIKSKPKKNNGVLLLPVILPNGSWFDLMEQFVRHATPEEIAAGYRIDCEILDYPEDYTSPNCKKYDERVK